MTVLVRTVIVATLSAITGASQACWDAAAARYGLPADLLYAMAQVESSLNAEAINLSHRSRTGTYDVGLMQINSSNFRKLSEYGIKEPDLYDPCTNIQTGAWILSQKVAKYGLSWEAVGAYNAACSRLHGNDCQQARAKYAWAVYRKMVATRSGVTTDHYGNRRARRGSAKVPVAPVIIAVRVAQ
jgi:soluble lytic murein transglycosylase-like protein